jgi:hypothetical protein
MAFMIDDDVAGEMIERLDSLQEEVKALYEVVDRNRLTQAALLDALTRERGAHCAA